MSRRYILGGASTLEISPMLWDLLKDLDAVILQEWCSMWIPNAHVEITQLRLVEE
jgi:hypothetical protein